MTVQTRGVVGASPTLVVSFRAVTCFVLQSAFGVDPSMLSLAEAGFGGASVPVGIDPDGRERLVFIPGDVAIPPYPTWVQSDAALGSVARLLRRMHDVSTTVAVDVDATWSREMADPLGGNVFCHNDVCLENVVFRDGAAVALLDFDFAAPGRREFDLASFARMCVPIDDDAHAARLGWMTADRPARLRLVCDEYGLDGPGRALLLGCLDEAMACGGDCPADAGGEAAGDEARVDTACVVRRMTASCAG
jgi:hypothetical protein